jgi:uncharacterized protein
MANPNAVHEPSMEEILASIRQIISEDGGSSSPKIDGVATELTIAPRPARAHEDAMEGQTISEDAAEHEHTPEDAAYSVAEEHVEQEGAQGEPDTHHGAFMRSQAFGRAAASIHPDADHSDAERLAAAAAALNKRPSADDDEPLLSPESDDAISGAFGALAHSLLGRSSRSLEDVVIEMLQPMLKQWLDANLPSIVERKVQEEIERVSRGRR